MDAPAPASAETAVLDRPPEGGQAARPLASTPGLAALDAHPDCAMLIERDRTVSFVSRNGRCPRTLQPFDILSGTDWLTLYPDSAREELRKALDGAMSGQDETARIEIATDKGEARPWLFELSPVYDEGSPRPSRILCLCRPDPSADAVLAMKSADHRIKNSLSTVASLLRLQSRASDSEANKVALTGASRRIDVVADLHGLNRYGGTGSEPTVCARDYIEQLTRGLIETLGADRVTVLREVAPVSLSPARAKALGFIVTEAVHNAVRHGFQGRAGGLIRLTLEERGDDEGLSLGVVDTGRGLPDAFDWRAARGTGGRIMDLYVHGLGGTLALDRAPSGGTRLSVTL